MLLTNKVLMHKNTFLYLTPQVGFEPTTNRLTVDRSATELLRIAHNLNKYSEKKNF